MKTNPDLLKNITWSRNLLKEKICILNGEVVACVYCDRKTKKWTILPIGEGEWGRISRLYGMKNKTQAEAVEELLWTITYQNTKEAAL
jgi:hypothetical protein